MFNGLVLPLIFSELLCILFSRPFFAFLIVLNAFTIAIAAQYEGIKTGGRIRYPGSGPTDDTWNTMKDVVDIFEFCFGICFTLELVLKLLALRCNFYKSLWNLFDTIIVVGWLLGEVAKLSLVVNPMILRLCRLARIMRLVRLLESFQACDSLHVLINSVQASFIVLAWSTTLLALMITLVGLVTQHLAAPFFENNQQQSMQQQHAVFEYYGTFTRSAVTFFEATLGNFGPIMRVLSENVGESWALYFILYKCIGGFAIVSVITGVILHETFGVAQTDPDLMVVKERRKKRLQAGRLIKLFQAADHEGRGSLTYADFQSILGDPFISLWLEAMELNVGDVELLFELLDDGDKTLTAEELLKGVGRLKGAARSIDLHVVMRELNEVKDQADRIENLIARV
jgi:membrane protein implicated in regulation of membrane protease activity